jgi:purine-cytosine permease-like protein
LIFDRVLLGAVLGSCLLCAFAAAAAAAADDDDAFFVSETHAALRSRVDNGK